MSIYNSFGEKCKKLRIGLKKTLRVFCIENGYDAGNISKMERGLTAPPLKYNILRKYATSLGLEENTPEYQEFTDLAYACLGVIPPDLFSNEYLVGKLPILFHEIRNKSDINNLIETIRNA